MNQNDLTQLTDEELLAEFKKIKPSPIIDAFFIGFLIGILLFGFFMNPWGAVSLLPLTIIYAFLKKPKQYTALKNELEARKLEQGRTLE
jgi:F0F1-type ATP synthase assembly protein I